MMQLSLCSKCPDRFSALGCIVYKIINFRANNSSLERFYKELRSHGIITLHYSNPSPASKSKNPCYKIVKTHEYIREYVFNKEMHELIKRL